VQRLWDGLVWDNQLKLFNERPFKRVKRSLSKSLRRKFLHLFHDYDILFNKRFQLSLLDVALSNMLI